MEKKRFSLRALAFSLLPRGPPLRRPTRTQIVAPRSLGSYRALVSPQQQTKIVKQTKRGAKHKTMYKCTICLKSFQKPSQLMRHIRVHTGEKPFKVRRFVRETSARSIPIDIGGNVESVTIASSALLSLVQCTVCSRAFTQKSSLQIHAWQHNGIRPHTCSLCNAKFSQKGSVIRLAEIRGLS